MHTPFFGKHMSKDRFFNILSNLHICDNAQANDDRLHKVCVFINMLNNNFDKYEPKQMLALDEGTCPFKVGYLLESTIPLSPINGA